VPRGKAELVQIPRGGALHPGPEPPGPLTPVAKGKGSLGGHLQSPAAAEVVGSPFEKGVGHGKAQHLKEAGDVLSKQLLL